jgi:hypothetical protein
MLRSLTLSNWFWCGFCNRYSDSRGRFICIYMYIIVENHLSINIAAVQSRDGSLVLYNRVKKLYVSVEPESIAHQSHYFIRPYYLLLCDRNEMEHWWLPGIILSGRCDINITIFIMISDNYNKYFNIHCWGQDGLFCIFFLCFCFYYCFLFSTNTICCYFLVLWCITT